ncbi:hypothetical protein EPD60_15770 [Flaviaesturariibacter flavus]|uniref:Sulfatase N-terminal domain-containing protein n=1 Tax=Flaviaesturariibacter flavus TaxID=2502780 RepID=A0A4R1B1W5_9BACT|nr:hypothetical protein [Flaviaesturariibacter flavus]TCJ12014.1 hypothetical protein EPD60_15770 [Flaviaesturariibacter flavus]
MSNRSFIPRSLHRWPLFLALLPMLSLWHAGNELFGFVRAGEALQYLLYCGTWIAVFFGCARLLLRSTAAAVLLAFFLAVFFVFFGAVYDAAAKLLPVRLVSYKLFPFVLLAVLLLAARGCIRARRAGKPVYYYLNLLLLVLCATEAVTSVFRYSDYRRHHNLIIADMPLSERFQPAMPQPEKPDVYVLVLDEYSRADALQRMGFNNQPFVDSLRALRFFVADSSRANYNFTPYAMGSCLNMRYVDPASGTNGTDPVLMLRAVHSVSDNETFRIFRKMGYELRFYASLDNPYQKRKSLNEFGNFTYVQVFGGLFTSRLVRDLGWRGEPLTALITSKPYHYFDLDQRERDIRYYLDETCRSADSARRAPRLVYCHLLLTHKPFLFDSAGRRKPADRVLHEEGVSDYLDQVRVANREMLDLISCIRENGKKNSIILLLSDHGSRLEKAHKADAFKNLCAIYYPDSAYGGLSPEQSPVNLFRYLFNQRFGQHYPLLPDSSVFVRYE